MVFVVAEPWEIGSGPTILHPSLGIVTPTVPSSKPSRTSLRFFSDAWELRHRLSGASTKREVLLQAQSVLSTIHLG